MQTHTIHFKRLVCRNIGTVGDMPLEIQLDRHPTTVVHGANGTGKSTIMLDAICFNLYNKPFKKIKIGELVNNRNNKDMYTELEFLKAGHTYRIVRCYKPQSFEIYRDGELIPSTNQYQQMLEEQIIGVPYSTFKQIVCMGRANYQSFLDLPKDKRRAFVETILDISIFREMLIHHKDNAKALEEDLRFAYADLNHKKSLVASIEQTLRDTTNERKQQLTEEMEKLQGRINLLNLPEKAVILGLIEEMNTMSSTLEGMKQDEDKTVQQTNAMKRSLRVVKEEGVCPACSQSISPEYSSEQSASLEERIQSLENQLFTQMNLREDQQSKLSQRQEYIQTLKTKAYQRQELQEQIDRLKQQVEQLQASSSTHKQLQEAQEQLQSQRQKCDELEQQQNLYRQASDLLSDSGIKTIIIDRYLPTINMLINKNLSELGLFATLNLTSDFSYVLKKRGFEDFSYHQLSEGEKLRVDLSIMLAWREIAALKSNLSINLTVMDEIFNTSMDYQGCKAFIDVLNSMTNTSVFIISPNAEDIIDMCRSSIKLELIKGYAIIV